MKEKSFFNGRWKVVEEIGQGTTGTVYKAVNSRGGVNSYSAIKEILLPKEKKEILNMYSQGATDSDITEYFENKANEWIAKEVNFLEQFKGNPNIVAIEDHDVLEREDMLGRIVVIRMELLETLEDYILTHEVTDKEILKMGLSILNALVDCEERNVLHRDIKPQNVFVNKNKIFKLGDFSESKEIEKTVSNMTQRGTPNYMAPELYKGERGSKSIDTYSLGIMLYQYFNNNKLPFMPEKYKFEDAQKVLEKRMNGEALPNPKNANEELSRIILKACSYKPEDRYKSAMEFKDELEKIYKEIDNPVVLFKSKEKKEVETSKDNKTVGIYSDVKEDVAKKNSKKKSQFGEEFVEKQSKEENEDNISQQVEEKPKKAKQDYNETVGIFYDSVNDTTKKRKTSSKKKQFGTEEKIEQEPKQQKEELKDTPKAINEKKEKNQDSLEKNKNILENQSNSKKKWKYIRIGVCIIIGAVLLFFLAGSTVDNGPAQVNENEFKEITAQQIASVAKDKAIVLYLGREDCKYCEMFVPVIKKVQEKIDFYTKTYYLDMGKIYDFNNGTVLDSEALGILKNLKTGYAYDYGVYQYNPDNIGTTPQLLVVINGRVDAALVGYANEEELSNFIYRFSSYIKNGN